MTDRTGHGPPQLPHQNGRCPARRGLPRDGLLRPERAGRRAGRRPHPGQGPGRRRGTGVCAARRRPRSAGAAGAASCRWPPPPTRSRRPASRADERRRVGLTAGGAAARHSQPVRLRRGRGQYVACAGADRDAVRDAHRVQLIEGGEPPEGGDGLLACDVAGAEDRTGAVGGGADDVAGEQQPRLGRCRAIPPGVWPGTCSTRTGSGQPSRVSPSCSATSTSTGRSGGVPAAAISAMTLSYSTCSSGVNSRRGFGRAAADVRDVQGTGQHPGPGGVDQIGGGAHVVQVEVGEDDLP